MSDPNVPVGGEGGEGSKMLGVLGATSAGRWD
jgi:hypothetical protein